MRPVFSHAVICICIILIAIVASGKKLELNEKVINNFAYSSEWLKLNHYKKNFFGNYESQVDGKDFFLSPDGKYNPHKELLTTIKLLRNKKLTAEVQCRFPARVSLIEKYFDITIDQVECDDFKDFSNKFKFNSFSLVYTSYFMNNPASIFGHTFFKSSDSSSSIDLGIDFTADVLGEFASPLYIVSGLFGRYKGRYSVVSFFEKVREYNDFENRDLWVYHIDLTMDEKNMMIRHLWELKQTYYDYFFLTENCSYHCLSLIEAAAPKYNLTGETNKLVVPIDTIKILRNNSNFISDIEYLPSLRKIFINSYLSLTHEDKKQFNDCIDNRVNNIKSYSNIKTKILDVLIDYYNYKYPAGKLNVNDSKEDREIFNIKRLISIARSERKIIKIQNNNNIKAPVPPHEIHGSRRLSFFSGYNSLYKSYYIQPEIRLTYHDFNDPSKGYPVDSEVEMGKLSLVYYFDDAHLKNSIKFNEFTFIKITSYSNFLFFQDSLSWGIDSGVYKFIDKRSGNQDGVISPYLGPLIGLSFLLSPDNTIDTFPSILFFSFLKFSLSYSNDYHDMRSCAGIGSLAGVKFSISPKISLKVDYEYLWYLSNVNNSALNVVSRFEIIKNLALDICFIKSSLFYDVRFGVMKFL